MTDTAEHIEGFKAYISILDIPLIPMSWRPITAKRFLAAYEMQLQLEQQKAYDTTMTLSEEKGPCWGGKGLGSI